MIFSAFFAAFLFASATPVTEAALRARFATPPAAARPWCYWHWQNGHADEDSITADLEGMKRLGFGGFMLSDSRGYWDDADHAAVPKAEIEVMSPEWRRLVMFALREARRLGLKVTFNTATSGGKLCGPWKVGEDAPKRLMCRVYPQGAALETPDFPYWHEVAKFEVRAAAEKVAPLVARGWYEAGDGTKTQVAAAKNERGLAEWIPLSEDGARYVVRFGSTTVPGHECDVDVLDPKAIAAHFNRFTGAIMDEIGPDYVGTNATIVGIYSVSWEGIVPMWSGNFAADFSTYAHYDFEKALPVLAGFVPAGVEAGRVMTDCRRARNAMFRDNFYGTLRRLAAERGVIMFSENGGPWHREKEIFGEADQLSFYAVNDMPQGEFWVNEKGESDYMFSDDDRVVRFFTRGAVSAAHVYGKPRVSMEAFTHMRRHWTMSPSLLKIASDRAFADGANHFVWHTYSLSPATFGVPGCEYFAGTHINGNVTWHDEARAFVDYLARCECLLTEGESVVDLALEAGETPYAGWGRCRAVAPGGAVIPAGYNYDLVDAAAWATSRVVDGRRVFPSGMSYPARLPALPDMEGPFAFCHRRIGELDLYFLEGRAVGTVTFRLEGRRAELWDPVTGEVRPLAVWHTNDRRTAVSLDLRGAGSAFVLLSKGAAAPVAEEAPRRKRTLAGDWSVSFAYHRLAHTRHLPAPRTLRDLEDWTLSSDDDLRHFAGTATYRTTFAAERPVSAIDVGALASGLAHVYLNGVDCGVAWCAPWSVKVPAHASVRGENRLEIRYTNNWINRLIGDAALPEGERVTRSNLILRKGARVQPGKKPLGIISGYSSEDPLQPSGLTGPVEVEFAEE